MRKKIWIAVIAFAVIGATSGMFESAHAQTAQTERSVLQTAYAKVTDGLPSEIRMTGIVSADSAYVRDVRIEIYAKKGGKIQASFPVFEGGYAPQFTTADFLGEKTQQIFCVADTGGSGGFGEYGVYRIKDGKAETLFTEQSWQKRYFAVYRDGYKVEVIGNKNNERFLFDLSGRPQDYLNQIYAADGSLLQPLRGEVSGVNTVFVDFRTPSGRSGLQIWQRVTGLYGADGIGYIVALTQWNDGQFEPYFTLAAAQPI